MPMNTTTHSDVSQSQAESAYFSKEALSGVPWLIINKLLLFFVYMGLSILTVRLLGPDEYGRFVLARSITEFLVVICALGMDTSLLRFIPELVAHKNRAGLSRFLVRALAVQQIAACIAIGSLFLLRPFMEKWFGMSFEGLLLPAGLLLAATMLKDALNNIFTALFRTRTVALLSLLNGLLWLFLLIVALRWRPEASLALSAQTASLILVYGASLIILTRLVRNLNWRSPLHGLGRERILKLSIPVMLNALLRMFMLKYTEVFFLGIYFTPAIIGYYDLGYATPMLVLTLIPAALQTLFMSAFAQAYARDPSCLNKLIDSVYKVTILIVVPLAAFGFFFAARAIVLFYGKEMAPAGPIAALFCILHVLPLISTPLSIAITVKEKVLHMLPYMLLQVGVNLLLDIALIPRWGMYGAVAAVGGTFFLTIPWRLNAVRAILGGIYFPTRFFIRHVLVMGTLSALLSPLAAHLTIFTLTLLGLTYLLAYPFAIRYLHLLQPADVADLRALNMPRVNRVLDLLVKQA